MLLNPLTESPECNSVKICGFAGSGVANVCQERPGLYKQCCASATSVAHSLSLVSVQSTLTGNSQQPRTSVIVLESNQARTCH